MALPRQLPLSSRWESVSSVDCLLSPSHFMSAHTPESYSDKGPGTEGESPSLHAPIWRAEQKPHNLPGLQNQWGS